MPPEAEAAAPRVYRGMKNRPQGLPMDSFPLDFYLIFPLFSPSPLLGETTAGLLSPSTNWHSVFFSTQGSGRRRIPDCQTPCPVGFLPVSTRSLIASGGANGKGKEAIL
jgi:hypothetical protein